LHYHYIGISELR